MGRSTLVLGSKKCNKVHLPSEEIWFFLFSPKTRRLKVSGCRKFQPRQLRRCQCSLAKRKWILQARLYKMSVKIKKRSGQWGMSNLFRKFQKFQLFLTKTGQKVFLANTISTRRPLECCSIDQCKKLALAIFLQRRDSKIYTLPSKKSGNWNFYR